MTALVDKIAEVVPREEGERIVCAVYANVVHGSIGTAVVAVSNRHVFVAPRSAFLSRGAWTAKALRDIRVRITKRRSIGRVAAYRFEVAEADGSSLLFEVGERSDARMLRRALGPRLEAAR